MSKVTQPANRVSPPLLPHKCPLCLNPGVLGKESLRGGEICWVEGTKDLAVCEKDTEQRFDNTGC